MRHRTIAIGQPVRWLAQLIHRHHLEDPLSQFVWLVAVGIFAHWTLVHYQVPDGGIPWIGMTIRTTVFALWGQVMREWLALRWWRPKNDHGDQSREDV